MPDEDFPVTEYFQGHVLEGETLSKVAGWWSAVLLIRDPRTEKPFIGLYRWQKSADVWKTRKRFSLKNMKDVKAAMAAVRRFSEKMEEAEAAEAAKKKAAEKKE